MSEFRSELQVRLIRGEYDSGRHLWALLAPFRYSSDLLGREVTVPAGFVTDFESIPLAVLSLSGRACPEAGVVHDWLYQSHECADKDEADHVYQEAMVVAGLDPVRAEQRFASVQSYGGKSWDTGPTRQKILT
ncbi:MAG: DUF1353 domain-containing protein [Candidatus Rokubacteria bacterium]|nr:DUF1353 domain-containing protein [Candidatus Rokubacteria bacterium]